MKIHEYQAKALLRDGARLRRRIRDLAPRHRHAELAQQRLGLVLVLSLIHI